MRQQGSKMLPISPTSPKVNPGIIKGENSINYTPQLLSREIKKVRKQIKEILSGMTENTIKQLMEVVIKMIQELSKENNKKLDVLNKIM